MSLAANIGILRDQILGELDDAHDYYENTKSAWRIVASVANVGASPTTRNDATGNVTSHEDLVEKSRQYIAGPLAEATFLQFISLFEAFVFDILRLWLTAHPRSLIGRKLDFKEVLEARDLDDVVAQVVDRELNGLLYERPAGWFAYLKTKVNIDRPTVEQVERIAEAKATRDALIHNRGVVTVAYLSKSGSLERAGEGVRLEMDEDYHRATWRTIRDVVAEVADAASARAA